MELDISVFLSMSVRLYYQRQSPNKKTPNQIVAIEINHWFGCLPRHYPNLTQMVFAFFHTRSMMSSIHIPLSRASLRSASHLDRPFVLQAQ